MLILETEETGEIETGETWTGPGQHAQERPRAGVQHLLPAAGELITNSTLRVAL